MGKNQKNHQNVLEITPNLIQNEQGRSMVEMLGVLAIVGVLSVGAISGYRYAMNKYRANQVINELNLLSHQVAIAMMSKNGLSDTLTLGEPYDSGKLASSGYEFAYGCGESGNDAPCAGQDKFNFTVQGVSEGVCKELIKTTDNMQYIKQVLPDVCEAADNNMSFVFEVPDAIITNSAETSTTDEASADLPTSCSGHGILLYGKCNCDAGYTGGNCQKTPEEDCFGHGTLTNGKCNCDNNYFGMNCEYKTDCSNHGHYDARHEMCTCTGNWGGTDCSIENPCSGGGTWVNYSSDSSGYIGLGFCDCPDGLSRLNCDEPHCKNGSTWDMMYSRCACLPGFEGDDCSKPAGTTCKNGGTLSNNWDEIHFGYAHCVCPDDFTGEDCSIPK